MYCKECGKAIGKVRFCPHCGTKVAEKSTSDPSFTEKIKQTFEDMTGGDNQNVQFGLHDLWRDALKKHTTEEKEQLLVSGTGAPLPLNEAAKSWCRPWLYSRVFAVLFVTLTLLVVCALIFENLLVLPGLVFIGALTIPFTLLILLWETNIPRNISIFDLVKMFFVGGVASLLFSLTIFSFINPLELNFIGAIIVGIVEEVGKLIATAIFIRRTNCKYLINGLLIGAAIGTGFAVFESAGYALIYSANLDDIIQSIILRGVLSLGGHVVWSAMTGAAVMLAKGEAPFSLDVFKKLSFWRLFLVPVILHALWDMPFSTIPVLVALVVAAWIFILALIRSGMREISQKANALSEAKAAEPASEQ